MFSTSFSVVRSSHRRCSARKGVFRNFIKFTGKHLCQSLFFNKLKKLNFIKKETLAQVFSCEFCWISKNTFFYRTPPDDCFYAVWFWLGFSVSIVCWKPSTVVAETSILGVPGGSRPTSGNSLMSWSVKESIEWGF